MGIYYRAYWKYLLDGSPDWRHLTQTEYFQFIEILGSPIESYEC